MRRSAANTHTLSAAAALLPDPGQEGERREGEAKRDAGEEAEDPWQGEVREEGSAERGEGASSPPRDDFPCSGGQREKAGAQKLCEKLSQQVT